MPKVSKKKKYETKDEKIKRLEEDNLSFPKVSYLHIFS